MSDLTSEQQARHAVLDSVLHLFRGDELPPTADVLAMAEWVADASNATAMALEGQKAALYDQHRGLLPPAVD
jgi:hypothetical protein